MGPGKPWVLRLLSSVRVKPDIASFPGGMHPRFPVENKKADGANPAGLDP
jgi:hypothetical protein|tara:strand:+ start:1418 stop:1567 length:150 start_codon:yes stop_codon:yes gene_type:complete